MSEWTIDVATDWFLRPGGPGGGTSKFVRTASGDGAPEDAYARALKGPLTLELKLKLVPSGRYEPVELKLTSKGETVHLTSTMLREIPLARICSDALPELKAYWGSFFGAGVSLDEVPTVPQKVIDNWPNGDTRSVFEWVRTVYEAALKFNMPPTKTVAEKFGMSYARGAYLVRRARETGVLQVSSANDPTKRKRTSNDGKDSTRDR